MLPEKIIFAIDCDQRAGEYIRYRGHRDGFIHKLDVVKNALSLFIRQKHAMSQKHQFAICTLHKKVEMVQSFSSSPDAVIKALGSISASHSEYGSLHLNALFSKTAQYLPSSLSSSSPSVSSPSAPVAPLSSSPPYTLRYIFIYFRSSSPPTCAMPLGIHSHSARAHNSHQDNMNAETSHRGSTGRREGVDTDVNTDTDTEARMSKKRKVRALASPSSSSSALSNLEMITRNCDTGTDPHMHAALDPSVERSDDAVFRALAEGKSCFMDAIFLHDGTCANIEAVMGCVPSLTGEKGLVFENSNHVKRLHRQIGELQSHPAVRKEKRGKRGVDK